MDEATICEVCEEPADFGEVKFFNGKYVCMDCYYEYLERKWEEERDED